MPSTNTLIMSSSHQRRPHTKSRKGCYSCKQKHVKVSPSLPPPRRTGETAVRTGRH